MVEELARELLHEARDVHGQEFFKAVQVLRRRRGC